MGRGVAAAAVVLALGGCPSSGAFQCSDHAECQTGDAFGICQPDGYCSFDDPACESGQRYGDQSGPLAGQCVAPMAATEASSGSATSGPDPVTSTMAVVDSSGAADPTTGGPGADSTTASVDPSTTSTSSATTDGGSSEGSTGGVPMCTPVLVDEFDDDVIDPMYDQDVGFGMTVVESGGQLHFGFDGLAAGGYSFIGMSFGPMTSHRFWVEQAALPAAPSSSTVDMCLSTPMWSACMTTFEDEHQAFLNPAMMQVMVGATPVDPVTARYVAISLVAGEVRYEVSGDGVMWQTFHTEPTPFDPADEIYVFLGAGNWEVVDASAAYVLESLGICQL